MIRYISLLLFIGLAWGGSKPSIYIFNFQISGIKDNRPVKAIQNIIQKSFRKSKQYIVKNDNQVIDYINEYKIDIKHCDTNCFKNIGFNNELDYLVTGKVKKTGTNWNLAISIIDVKTSAEPVLISVKSKQGTMKLISKLEKKLNKYILN